jgi:hypothetical protein
LILSLHAQTRKLHRHLNRLTQALNLLRM